MMNVPVNLRVRVGIIFSNKMPKPKFDFKEDKHLSIEVNIKYKNAI